MPDILYIECGAQLAIFSGEWIFAMCTGSSLVKRNAANHRLPDPHHIPYFDLPYPDHHCFQNGFTTAQARKVYIGGLSDGHFTGLAADEIGAYAHDPCVGDQQYT